MTGPKAEKLCAACRPSPINFKQSVVAGVGARTKITKTPQKIIRAAAGAIAAAGPATVGMSVAAWRRLEAATVAIVAGRAKGQKKQSDDATARRAIIKAHLERHLSEHSRPYKADPIAYDIEAAVNAELRRRSLGTAGHTTIRAVIADLLKSARPD